jgi:5-methylcytosine-specific restriction endonuclease McrA
MIPTPGACQVAREEDDIHLTDSGAGRTIVGMATQRSARPWRRLRQAVLDASDGRCAIRGPTCTGWATQVDHVVAVADGGGDDWGNLRPSCRACNLRAGAQTTNDRARRHHYRDSLARYVTRF